MSLLKVGLRGLAVAGLVYRAKKHKSLTNLGLVVAAVTATIHAVHPWSLSLILLFAFYMSGNRATKYNHQIKSGLTVTFGGKGESEQAPRNHIQVLANSVMATILILLHFVTRDDALMFGVVANYAAVTADTLSSELGILSTGQPYLITTLKPCPRGTNGGISILGLKVAVAGGLLIGGISVFSPLFANAPLLHKLFMVFVTGFLGLYGSILDSILGATMQKSVINKQGKVVEAAGGYKLEQNSSFKTLSGKDWLSNNQVNLLMAAITSMLGIVLYKIVF